MDASGVALITGASRGIGRALALDLAREGFDVVATMRDPSAGATLVDELGDATGSIRVARLDVTDPTTIDIPDDLRVLVNNAGVELDYLPIEHTPLDHWRTVFETNVFGLAEVTRQAIPVLRRNGGGVICNVTSSSVFAPMPFYAVYRASKAAVQAMGDSLRTEVKGFGIRVVEILPGPVQSDMLAGSDRRYEAADYDGYAEMAQASWDQRRAIGPYVTSAEDAAAAIRRAILTDDGPLRWGCDPMGGQLLAAWRGDPEVLLKAMSG
jgi:NAD(P)-dependent dehydrogenase (short-subunit alcohol dehydrogenase family)